MAKNPKVKDPTEVALSAIQEALNISDPSHQADDQYSPSNEPLRAPESDFGDARFGRQAANDDREAIGAVLQSLQRGRPRRSAYTFAAIFSGLWIAAAGFLIISFLPSLEAMIGSNGGALALVGLALVFVTPLILFYFLASVSWRSQELSMIAQSMAQMAVRFSEPEHVASDAMVTVGQAIRREVAAMGDGVERAIARAGELEALVTNEVSALERAYSDNEVRIRALLQDISTQRDNLVGQAEQVRNAISGVQIDLRQDIAIISDAIASRVDEVTNNITHMLEERSDHITGAFAAAGDNMIIALGERGGDLLDRLEEASNQTANAVLEASETLTANLNFKTNHIHDEFAELADNIHELLNERVERITGDFEQRANSIVDGITMRTEQVHDTLRNSGDSLLNEMDLRSIDLVAKVDEAGNRLADRILTTGDTVSEALDVTVNTLVAKVASQTESSHEALTSHIASFETLMHEQGGELAEKFARDSGTLGALITRHVAEFDRTVKTYGGEIVERMGQHTQNVSDNLKAYVDNFDTRVTAHGAQIHDALDERLGVFQNALDSRVTTLEVSLDTTIKSFDSTIDQRLSALELSFDKRAALVTQTIDTQSTALADTLSTRFGDMQKGIETHAGAVASDIEARVVRFENLLDIRVESAAHRVEASGQKASETLLSRTEEITQTIKSRVEDSERSLTSLALETSEAIQSGARNAQQSLLALSGEVGTQLRSTTTDIEHTIQTSAREAESTLFLASNNASAQIKSASAEIERTIVSGTESFGQSLSNKIEEITGGVREQAERLEGILDDKRTPLTAAITAKTEQLVQVLDSKSGQLVGALATKSHELAHAIGGATASALKSIETQSGDFTAQLMNQSSDISRQIAAASELATGSVGKALKDVETSTRAAIDQSRQVATAAVTEMQETSKILRTATVALFERLREGNILLQEVLTGAHENLNSLERALVTRVADFVTALNDVTSRNGASTTALEEQLRTFNESTTGALQGLGSLSAQFESHGRMLSDAVRTVEESNDRTSQSVAERQGLLEQLTTTIDTRTLDLDERLNRFVSLLEESLNAAELRARDIARVVAESAGASSSAVGRQFEAVRMAVEDERRQTLEAMGDIYDRGTQDAASMFTQASDKFSDIVHSMKQMAVELHQELDATRADLRRGVLELPQEASENTAQMRKVIVDQIEALAELNRIVARHGRGLDVASTRQREEEPAVAVANSRAAAPAPRGRDYGSASNLPPPDLGAPNARRTEAPSVSPAGSDQARDGWLSDLLNRTDANISERDNGNGARRSPQAARAPSGNPLDALSLDISRLVDRDLAAEMWDRYQRGERKAFNKRLYTPAGQKAFDEVARKYRADRTFKQTVDRYINEFERLLDEVSRDERGPAVLRTHLTSETGLVYTLLAHAAGRLG